MLLLDTKTKRSLAALALAVVTLAVFAQVWSHAFVEFEDPTYVTENPRIRYGLSRDAIIWAFTNRIVLPLTWLSHAVDAGLYGVEDAGPHALTNVGLHVVNALLLLHWLSSVTRRPGSSLFVAALFALHPLHVESVAWVSARKDVLSTLFLLLMLLAWTRWVEQRDRRAYAGALASLVLGLMAKPILVSAPVLLVLLDFWPFARLRADRLKQLALEKLPFFGLALLSAGIVLLVSDGSENFWGTDPPLLERLGGAAICCVLYLWKLAWPVGLTIVYPTPAQQGLGFWPTWQVAGACVVLAAITVGAVRHRARHPYLLVGWLWFLVVLGPVLQIVPSGLRVMHDRYTYVSAIGIFVAVAFGAASLSRRLALPGAALPAIGAAALAACVGASFTQVGTWRDTDSLLAHAAAVTQRNAILHHIRGTAWAKQGRFEEAAAEMEQALSIRSDLPDVQNNLGYIRLEQGRVDAAIEHYRRALELRPRYGLAAANLGNALLSRGDVAEGVAALERAVEFTPESANGHYWLGTAYLRQGDVRGAELQFRSALQDNPKHAWAAAALGLLLEASRRDEEAVRYYRRALESLPDHRLALRRLAWLLATAPDSQLRDGREAVAVAERLAVVEPGSYETGRTLAAAYAEAAEFERAVTALRATRAALSADDEDLAERIEEIDRCIGLYESGQSFRPAGR